jgi:Tfp pilus assembly protein PilZ
VEYFKVKKISQSGLLVESKSPLEIEDAVPMTMDLSENQSIAFWGRIVTCKAAEKTDLQSYVIGLEFTDMSESDRTTLKKFIDSLEGSPQSA